MTVTPEFRPARRGDGIVVGTRHSGYTIPEPGRTETYEYDSYEVGTVTGITRDGLVRTWRVAWASDADRKQELPRDRIGYWLLPAAEIDVAACLAAYRAHHYPGHEDGLPQPYASLEEVRDAMRPHRKGTPS
jgi:hypothetical protein